MFAQGIEQEVGQAVEVLLFEVPYQTEAITPFQSGNPYLAIFASFDLVYIFQLVLGLLAILIASETISGEKEDGTLRLMLTTNVSRAQVLAGKILAWPDHAGHSDHFGLYPTDDLAVGHRVYRSRRQRMGAVGAAVRAVASILVGVLSDWASDPRA